MGCGSGVQFLGATVTPASHRIGADQCAQSTCRNSQHTRAQNPIARAGASARSPSATPPWAANHLGRRVILICASLDANGDADTSAFASRPPSEPSLPRSAPDVRFAPQLPLAPPAPKTTARAIPPHVCHATRRSGLPWRKSRLPEMCGRTTEA